MGPKCTSPRGPYIFGIDPEIVWAPCEVFFFPALLGNASGLCFSDHTLARIPGSIPPSLWHCVQKTLLVVLSHMHSFFFVIAFPDPPNLQKVLRSDLCSQRVPMVWAGSVRGWFLACLCGTCYSVAQTIRGGLGKGRSPRAGACLGLWAHP